MDNLISLIEGLKKTDIRKQIEKRYSEFKSLRKSDNSKLFIELCFCLMTANYDAAKAIAIQNKIGNGFINLSPEDLAVKLRALGYRFPNVRSKFIVEARKHKDSIQDILKSHKTDHGRRQWFAENVKGLGYKEASHFLRNIGYDDCAIIDFHIVDILVANKIIRKPKNLTKKNYLAVEKKLSLLAEKTGLTLSELDLYLWYLETGKILK